MNIYKYTDDSWVDGSEDDGCGGSGILFECYNAVNWGQNGSASSLKQLYANILAHYLEIDVDYPSLVYEPFSEGQLLQALHKLGITVEQVDEH